MNKNSKISKEDWFIVESLATRVTDAVMEEDDDLTDSMSRELLEALDQLQEKYGPLAIILATRADYVDDLDQAQDLLEQAYQAALEDKDAMNLTLITSSLAQLFVEEVNDQEKGRVWLDKFKEHLEGWSDDFEGDEYIRLEKLLEL